MQRRWTDKERKMISFTFAQSDSEFVLHNDPTIHAYDFSFLVENVEELCKEFAKKGYKVKMQPVKVRCGKYSILLDPDRNNIPIIDLTKFGGVPKYDTM